jgi:predicted porin
MNRRTSIALAAMLATLSGAAAAQMNVTLYGVLDAAAGRFKGAPGGVNARDMPVYKVEGGGMSTSHWGVRGSEDLGGGLLASFDLASFMRNDTGSVGRGDAIPAPVNVGADTYWSRAAWVALGSASLGRVRLGNVTTLMFFNSISSNAFGDSTVFSPINLVTFIGSPQAGGTGWTNSVVYDSPNFSGFGFSAARSLAETQGGRNSAVRAFHSQGPWAASFAWQAVKKNPLTFADGTSANNTTSWQLAGSYDFQVVKVFAHLGRIQNDGTESAPLDIEYRLWDVSASMPVGEGRVLAGYAQRKTRDSVAPVPATVAGGNLERRVLTVGYDHYLSKRTDLYAIVMNDKTRTNTLPASPTVVGASATSFAVGMRHRF